MLKLIDEFRSNQSGATAVEYGLIAGLISIIVVAMLTQIGTKLNVKLSKAANGLN